MEHRGSGSAHVAWARKLKELLQALGSYVKQHHAKGPAWNATGIPLSQFSGAPLAPLCCTSQNKAAVLHPLQCCHSQAAGVIKQCLQGL